MKRFGLLVSAALAMAATVAAQTAVVRDLSTEGTDGRIALHADSVMFRGDVTRVYATLTGQPHTSARIDAVKLTGADGTTLEATDIDGVDFLRWFQWEDDGRVTVEVDFDPAAAPATMPWALEIVARNPAPAGTWTVKANAPQKAKGHSKAKHKHKAGGRR